MFRFKSGINVTYNRQGYIYFTSLLYRELPEKDRKKIDELCREAGGLYADALFDFVTKDDSATALCMRYSLGRSTLYRCVKRYYENFPKL